MLVSSRKLSKDWVLIPADFRNNESYALSRTLLKEFFLGLGFRSSLAILTPSLFSEINSLTINNPHIFRKPNQFRIRSFAAGIFWVRKLEKQMETNPFLSIALFFPINSIKPTSSRSISKAIDARARWANMSRSFCASKISRPFGLNRISSPKPTIRPRRLIVGIAIPLNTLFSSLPSEKRARTEVFNSSRSKGCFPKHSINSKTLFQAFRTGILVIFLVFLSSITIA